MNQQSCPHCGADWGENNRKCTACWAVWVVEKM